GSIGSSVSSTMIGSPQAVPVAEATTYSQRGVITATPKDFVLGLIRWTRPATHTSAEYAEGIKKLLCFTREAASVPRFAAPERSELIHFATRVEAPPWDRGAKRGVQEATPRGSQPRA